MSSVTSSRNKISFLFELQQICNISNARWNSRVILDPIAWVLMHWFSSNFSAMRNLIISGWIPERSQISGGDLVGGNATWLLIIMWKP